MKTLLVTAFGLLIAALTQAQSLSGLPQCAQTCALNAIGSSGCPATNVTCICSSPTFISAFTSCVGTSCNATDAAAAQAFGIQYCASAGVTIGASSAAAPVTSTSAAASAAGPETSVPASATSAPAGVTTTASTTASASVQLFTGAAALLGYSWALLGIGGAVALGV